VTRCPYDLAVVGGGIAGLTIAEIFARSGRSVVLLERGDRLCQEASASQHGWFHFGSLYSIFSQRQLLRTMIGGVEDLLDYYAGFHGMNIAVTNEGHLAFPQVGDAWFRDEPIEYIVVARNDPDFDMRRFKGVRAYARKIVFLLTWEKAIKQFISRHQRFHKHNWRGATPASQWIPRAGMSDYTREVITKPNNPGVKLDCDTHFRIIGYDRPMRAEMIMADLTASLIGSGGEVHLGAEVERLEKVGSQTRIHTSAGPVVAQQVILAAGKWLGRFLPRTEEVKIGASPMLVAWPAVSDMNLVRMTPFVENSVNHLHHVVDGHRYSLIGGGHFADPEDPTDVARVSERLMTTAKRVFPRLREARVLETYLGYKTEFVPTGGERNYQYFIREVDHGVHAVIPGKFSLAFSLAANTFKRLTGEEPAKSVRLADRKAAQSYVGLTRHAQLVVDATANHQPTPVQSTIPLSVPRGVC
jgi:hypothetical protein